MVWLVWFGGGGGVVVGGVNNAYIKVYITVMVYRKSNSSGLHWTII